MQDNQNKLIPDTADVVVPKPVINAVAAFRSATSVQFVPSYCSFLSVSCWFNHPPKYNADVWNSKTTPYSSSSV